MQKKTCPKCGRELTSNNYQRHIDSCRGKIINHLTHEGLNCQYCGKECKNSNSLIQHEIRCKKNPQAILYQPRKGFNNKGREAWNKGLSKKTHPQLSHSKESIEKIQQKRAGYKHSPEVIRKMKLNPKIGGLRPNSGQGKKGHYKGLYCDSTYELVWTIYCLDHGIKFKRCQKTYTYSYKGEIHKYHPDYELEDGNLIEIKGYHNEVVDLKTASVTDVSIKVLYKKDLKEMFDYIKENYSYRQLTDLYD